MDKLYLCRHGETAWTLSGQHTGKTDIPLTERGKSQAARLRKRLQKIHFDAVFSSPKKRAIESCKGMQPIIDASVEEWDYGDYEGLASQEIHAKNPGWDLFTDGAPNGESPDEVGKRADQFLKRAGRCKGTVVIFSHGHFLRVLAARYLGLTPQMGKLFSLSVASLSILGESAIILWNETDEEIFSKASDDQRLGRGRDKT